MSLAAHRFMDDYPDPRESCERLAAAFNAPIGRVPQALERTRLRHWSERVIRWVAGRGVGDG